MGENNWRITVGKTVNVPKKGDFSSVKMEIECDLADIDVATNELNNYIQQELDTWRKEWHKEQDTPNNNNGYKKNNYSNNNNSYKKKPSYKPKRTYTGGDDNLAKGEDLKAEKGFGSPKQWKILLDKQYQVEAIGSYEELKDAVQDALNN